MTDFNERLNAIKKDLHNSKTQNEAKLNDDDLSIGSSSDSDEDKLLNETQSCDMEFDARLSVSTTGSQIRKRKNYDLEM